MRIYIVSWSSDTMENKNTRQALLKFYNISLL